MATEFGYIEVVGDFDDFSKIIKTETKQYALLNYLCLKFHKITWSFTDRREVIHFFILSSIYPMPSSGDRAKDLLINKASFSRCSQADSSDHRYTYICNRMWQQKEGTNYCNLSH